MSDQGKKASGEVGAGWIRESNGCEYVSLQFNDAVFEFDMLNCFVDLRVNDRKTKPSQPDYTIIAKPRTAPPAPASGGREGSAFPQPRYIGGRGRG